LLKTHVQELAIFGAPPLFDSPRPIGQLDAPDFSDYVNTLKEAYDRRQLTDGGFIVRKLENKFAAVHGTKHCIAVANAGLGITMLIQLFANGRKGEVIMPAFSYRGLPHFAQWAGQLPRFCDVDRQTHGLDPIAVESAINVRTTSILGVCNFNDPGDIEGLTRIAKRHDLPIFLDSVYAVGSTYKGRLLGPFTNAEVYSLHATKLLNGFEGGYITTNEDDLAEKLRWQRNFALPALQPKVPGTRNVIGLNAKLNEMHAAMAILSLDRMGSIISRNCARLEGYKKGLEPVDGVTLLPYASGEQVNYQMAVIEIGREWPLTRDQTVHILRTEGAGISAYYSPPLHRSEHCPAGIQVPTLPVAEELGQKFVQLPVGELTTLEDIERICQLLATVSGNGPAVRKRLRELGF
jgi:dTDP-4-amino-4,6-dideoxygalactose transaminase